MGFETPTGYHVPSESPVNKGTHILPTVGVTNGVTN